MSSDINELYKRVIYRNNLFTDLLTTSRSTPGELVMCQEKLVQEAVDTLLDNGIRGQPMRDGHNKVYKSFSDVIEGKEERFREILLGKRVDYLGCSVIVVGPSLSLHQCGLQCKIAIDTDKILFSGNGDILSIPLVMYQRSNKNTCMHQKSKPPGSVG